MELFNAYQKNFYIESGLRKIWQNDSECVEYDNELIYVPKLKICNFKNIEFNTNISFDKFGDIQIIQLQKLIIIIQLQ